MEDYRGEELLQDLRALVNDQRLDGYGHLGRALRKVLGAVDLPWTEVREQVGVLAAGASTLTVDRAGWRRLEGIFAWGTRDGGTGWHPVHQRGAEAFEAEVRALAPADPALSESMSATGVPEYYHLDGSRLRLTPAAGIDTAIEAVYQPHVAEVRRGTRLPLGRGHLDAVLYYAAAEVYAGRTEPVAQQQYGHYRGEADACMAYLRNDAHYRPRGPYVRKAAPILK